jgi:hypothetical protein
MDPLVLPVALGAGIPSYLVVGALTARRAYRQMSAEWYEEMIQKCLTKWRCTEISAEGMQKIDDTFRDDGSTEAVFGALLSGALWPITWVWGFIFGTRIPTGLEADTRKAVENAELRRKIQRLEREVDDDLQDQLSTAEAARQAARKAQRKALRDN